MPTFDQRDIERRLKPHGDGNLVREISGLIARMDERYWRVLCRMWLAGAVACIFLLGTMASTAILVKDNRNLIHRLDEVAVAAQTRGARTDAKQCRDIEELKGVARASTLASIARIRKSKSFSEEEKAGFIRDSEAFLKKIPPLTGRDPRTGKRLLGVGACPTLPSQRTATP